MISTWYKVSNSSDTIKPIEVTRATDKRIYWIQAYSNRAPVEHYADKVSAFERYFPTHAEAVQHLRERYERDIRIGQRMIDDAKAALLKLATLTTTGSETK